MVDPLRTLLGGLCVAFGGLAVYRLSAVARVALLLVRTDPTTTVEATDGATVAVEGTVFVDESAPAADRLFDRGPVGAYVWRAGFLDAGGYSYDSVRGSLRQARETFDSGVEAGRFGVTVGGQPLYVDTGWLRERYDAPALSEVEVGDPVGNASLPPLVTRQLFDSPYVTLRAVPGGCAVTHLTDVLELHREDVHTDEFRVDARAIPEGGELFVHGEVRVEDGRPVLTGTGRTPLVLSDRGRRGLRRDLLRTSLHHAYFLGFAAVVFWVVVL